jgi:hypothetical protein
MATKQEVLVVDVRQPLDLLSKTTGLEPVTFAVTVFHAVEVGHSDTEETIPQSCMRRLSV